MKTSRILATTALAALLATPVIAQQGDNATSAGTVSQTQLESYSVGELLGLTVMAADGSDAGQIEAVVEGQDGVRVLVALDEKTVALPIDAFSVSQGEQAVTVNRDMTELQDMTEFASSDEQTLDTSTAVADLVNRGNAGTQAGGTSQPADTAMTESDETMPSGELGDAAMAEGGGALVTEEQIDAARSEVGETPLGNEQGDNAMAQDSTSVMEEETDTATAGGGSGVPGAEQGARAYSGMTVGEVLGMPVITASGNDIGEIDYVYQTSGGYMAVIGIGGFLGIGENTVSLPLTDFTIDREQNALLLDGRTEEELENMQEVDESGLERLPDDHLINT